MGELIFSTNHLNKVYKETHALNNFTINIKKGSIYALMGPNGAGKTTLIRIVTGLARKTSGDMTLFGKETEKEYNSVRNKIGTLIETPALYRDKTAYENLNINRMLKKIDDKKEIDRVLEIVDLSNTKNKKVKNFSLGMKQRLGIAKALLGNPEFLILDEPINGLDPFGIIEIRSLILDLNKNHGITMLIASHILKELTMVATHYGMIYDGQIIDEFTAEELNDRCGGYIYMRANDIQKAKNVISQFFVDHDSEQLSDHELRLNGYFSKEEIMKISEKMVQNGVILAEFRPAYHDIETYFTSIIKKTKVKG